MYSCRADGEADGGADVGGAMKVLEAHLSYQTASW